MITTLSLKGEGNDRVIASLAIEAFPIQETNIAQGLSCLADRSSKSDEVEVQGQGLFLWDEGTHP